MYGRLTSVSSFLKDLFSCMTLSLITSLLEGDSRYERKCHASKLVRKRESVILCKFIYLQQTIIYKMAGIQSVTTKSDLPSQLIP